MRILVTTLPEMAPSVMLMVTIGLLVELMMCSMSLGIEWVLLKLKARWYYMRKFPRLLWLVILMISRVRVSIVT